MLLSGVHCTIEASHSNPDIRSNLDTMSSNGSGRHKGNLLIGQSGGATAVINASLAGAVQEALRSDQIDGIYGALHGIEGVLSRQIIDLRAISGETWNQIQTTPSAALGSCRYKLKPEDPQRALDILRALNVRCFLYIGGNDSADTAHRIAQVARESDYDLQVIGIPKTIDNDLPITDHCPGYGSAARFIALATMDSALCTEAIPHHFPVKIIEVMGRNAGWLAAASALGKERPEDAPRLIYVPERHFSPELFLAEERAVYQALGYVLAKSLKRRARLRQKQLRAEVAFGNVEQVGRVFGPLFAEGRSGGQPARVAPHHFDDLDREVMGNGLGAEGRVHRRQGDEARGAAIAGAVIGNGQVVINRFGNADDLQVII